MNTKPKLYLGLFEWLAWYQDAMPDFMTDSEFAQAGYNIQLSYKPYIGEDELRDTQVQGIYLYIRVSFKIKNSINHIEFNTLKILLYYTTNKYAKIM